MTTGKGLVMKSMSEGQYERYERILATWRAEGKRVSWREYRLAYAQALEEGSPEP